MNEKIYNPRKNAKAVILNGNGKKCAVGAEAVEMCICGEFDVLPKADICVRGQTCTKNNDEHECMNPKKPNCPKEGGAPFPQSCHCKHKPKNHTFGHNPQCRPGDECKIDINGGQASCVAPATGYSPEEEDRHDLFDFDLPPCIAVVPGVANGSDTKCVYKGVYDLCVTECNEGYVGTTLTCKYNTTTERSEWVGTPQCYLKYRFMKLKVSTSGNSQAQQKLKTLRKVTITSTPTGAPIAEPQVTVDANGQDGLHFDIGNNQPALYATFGELSKNKIEFKDGAGLVLIECEDVELGGAFEENLSKCKATGSANELQHKITVNMSSDIAPVPIVYDQTESEIEDILAINRRLINKNLTDPFYELYHTHKHLLREDGIWPTKDKQTFFTNIADAAKAVKQTLTQLQVEKADINNVNVADYNLYFSYCKPENIGPVLGVDFKDNAPVEKNMNAVKVCFKIIKQKLIFIESVYPMRP